MILLDLAGVAAVHAVEGQQMRVVLGGTQVVDGHEFDIRALGLEGSAQNQAANPTETVDGDANRHCLPTPYVPKGLSFPLAVRARFSLGSPPPRR